MELAEPRVTLFSSLPVKSDNLLFSSETVTLRVTRTGMKSCVSSWTFLTMHHAMFFFSSVCPDIPGTPQPHSALSNSPSTAGSHSVLPYLSMLNRALK